MPKRAVVFHFAHAVGSSMTAWLAPAGGDVVGVVGVREAAADDARIGLAPEPDGLRPALARQPTADDVGVGLAAKPDRSPPALGREPAADGRGSVDLAAELERWRRAVARRRALAVGRRAGIVAVAVVAVLLVARVAGAGVSVWAVAVLAAVVLGGLAMTTARRPSPDAAATALMLDVRLDLDARLSTAWALRAGAGSPAVGAHGPLAAAVAAEGDRLAGEVHRRYRPRSTSAGRESAALAVLAAAVAALAVAGPGADSGHDRADLRAAAGAAGGPAAARRTTTTAPPAATTTTTGRPTPTAPLRGPSATSPRKTPATGARPAGDPAGIHIAVRETTSGGAGARSGDAGARPGGTGSGTGSAGARPGRAGGAGAGSASGQSGATGGQSGSPSRSGSGGTSATRGTPTNAHAPEPASIPSAKHVQGLAAEGRNATHALSSGQSAQPTRGQGGAPTGAGTRGAGSTTGAQPGGHSPGTPTVAPSAGLPLQSLGSSGGTGRGNAGRVGAAGTGHGAPQVRNSPSAGGSTGTSTVPYVPAIPGLLPFSSTGIISTYFPAGLR